MRPAALVERSASGDPGGTEADTCRSTWRSNWRVSSCRAWRMQGPTATGHAMTVAASAIVPRRAGPDDGSGRGRAGRQRAVRRRSGHRGRADHARAVADRDGRGVTRCSRKSPRRLSESGDRSLESHAAAAAGDQRRRAQEAHLARRAGRARRACRLHAGRRRQDRADHAAARCCSRVAARTGARQAAPAAQWRQRFSEEVMRSGVELQATMPLARMTLGQIAGLQRRPGHRVRGRRAIAGQAFGAPEDAVRLRVRQAGTELHGPRQASVRCRAGHDGRAGCQPIGGSRREIGEDR